MKKLYLLLLFVVVAATSCTKSSGEQKVINRVKVGNEVPDFTVTDQDGDPRSFTLSDYEGFDATIITFISTGCSDCKREMPKIYEVYDHFDGSGMLQVINIGRAETAENMAQYWESIDPDNNKGDFGDMPWYLDPGREAYDLFANIKVPRIYLVDSSGEVVWMAVEKMDESAQDIIEMINNL